MIEPSSIYSCCLDPTHLPTEFIFQACLRVCCSPPMLPLNIRTDLMGDISNRPMYVLAVLNTGRWGGGRLPTVFNLAAPLLAFRADDKEMNDPRVLSHSLNVEFRRYPLAPVQKFTCFCFLGFFLVLHARVTFFSFLFIPQLLSMRLYPVCTAAT